MSRKKGFKRQSSTKSKRFKEPDQPPPDYNLRKPMFSFYHMVYGSNFCISKCCDADKSDLAHRLVVLSQHTWGQIISFSRETYGHEQIPLKQFNTTNFPKIITPDTKSLMVFRYSEAGRMAGIRRQDIYHVIFAGPDIYDH